MFVVEKSVGLSDFKEAGFQKERERTLQLSPLSSSLTVAVGQVGGVSWQPDLPLERDQMGAEGSCSFPRARDTPTGSAWGQESGLGRRE